MNSRIVQQVQELYSRFDESIIPAMADVYRADIIFQDPLQRVEGLGEVARYFAGTMKNLQECRFEFGQVIESSSQQSAGVHQAVLFWHMHYRHPKLAKGKLLTISGNSHIKFQDKVFYHRDYYDAGAMLYEHLPVMGWVIQRIKKRMEA